MLKRLISLFAVALALAVTPAALRAQASTSLSASSRPVYDAVTVVGSFGGLSGAANLNQAGTADWRLGWAASLDATRWFNDYLGVRAGAGWAQDSIRGATLTGRGKVNKFTYDADVVLRYPLRAGSGTFSPYLVGGLGAISVHQLDSDSTWSKFAGNYGVGLEYRFRRVGVRAEGRDFVYKFDRYGFEKTQHDIAWQGGLTLSF